ncbi:protein of unknown function DUF3447 - like 10 [Theobroma cacao]|nr:protein of unknown function DUF3447 - like 10 [Theobroma cacao]
MTVESSSITIGRPSSMQERVRNAANEGDIEALYELIREKADFLRDIDQMEFVDTPLHVAAAAGRTEFALELLDLKPSLATKLNQDGLSPMHLALQNKHAETVLSLLRFDKNLVRVKGKNGYTPFHYAVMNGDRPVLNEFLKDCPQCIHDVTNRNETGLHVAVQNNSFEAFQIVRLLTEYGIMNMKATNSKNLTGQNQHDRGKCKEILLSAYRAIFHPSAAGSSVLNTAPFLFFFIPNIMAFGISFLLTCAVLISILPVVLSTALVLSLSMLVVCLLISSVRIISPNSLSVVVMYETVDLLVGLPVLVMFLTIFLRLVISRLWRMAWKEN